MSNLLEKLNTAERKMMMLRDVAKIIPGFAFKSKDFGEEGVPVLKITEIQPPYVSFQKSDRVNIKSYDKNKLKKYFIRKGDYVVAMTGATIGKVGKVVDDIEALLNQRVAKIEAKTLVDPKFVYYAVDSSSFQGFINQIASGSSAQANISGDDIGEFELDLPDLPTQKKIAEILGAYDAKIENNNMVIKNLEATAQAIFNEWFMKFQFPGHEKVKMVDSELGLIPAGWEVKKISDVAILNKGVSYSSPEISDKPMSLPLINLKCFIRGGGFKLEGLKYYSGEFRKKHEVVPGQIVIALTDLTPTREVVGRPARVPIIAGFNKILISLDVCSLQTKEETKEAHEFLYYMLRRREFGKLMALSASGTTVAHLSAFNIENYEFVFPSKTLIQKFHEFIKETFLLQGDLSDQNQNLRMSRDQLLKKLV